MRARLGLLTLALLLFSAASAPAATEQKTYSPYTPEGERTIDVRDYRSADTCGSSFISGQRGPLRCFSGNYIYDPCFPDPLGRDEALCVASPEASSGVMLRGAPGTDDGYGGRPNPAPWALKLSNGAVCVFASGASNARRGLRLNYTCSDRRFLWGSPNKRLATWTIRRSRTYTGRGWRVAKIRTAWR